MDLQQEWQNMNAEITAIDQKQEHWDIRLDAESHNLMQSLLFKLKWKLRWIRIISVPILIAALFTKGDLQITFILMFMVYEIAGALGRRDFHKMKTGVDYTSTTRQVLEENFRIIHKMLKGERIWGYLFLSLAGPAGLIVYRLTVDNSFKNLFSAPYFVLLLCGLALIGFPFMYLAQKMNDNLFADHLKSLQHKIHELSE